MPIASLQDFRQQYPQYNDMSDTQVTDNLYSKYYSDMPREKFNPNIGGLGVGSRVNPQGDQSDIFNKSYAENPGLSKTAEYGVDTGLILGSTPQNLLKASGITSGLVNMGYKAVANYLLGTGISGP